MNDYTTETGRVEDMEGAPRRWHALRRSVQTMLDNGTATNDFARGTDFALGLVLDEMTTIEQQPAQPQTVTSTRACFFCGSVLMAARGFIETVSQPDGERRDFCSSKCLRLHLAETGTLL